MFEKEYEAMTWHYLTRLAKNARSVAIKQAIARMAERYDRARQRQKEIDRIILNIIDPLPIPYLLRLAYLNFGRQVWKTIEKHQGRVREQNLKIIHYTWQTRGLDPQHLNLIQDAIQQAINSQPA